MQYHLLVIGKLKNSPFQDLYTLYEERLRTPLLCTEIEIKNQSNPDLQAQEENKALLDKLDKDSFVIALDARGKALDSESFSKKLETITFEGYSKITFIIGGSQGLDRDVKKAAHMLLSFGQATWPHKLARVMLMEQLYRAQQIQAGHPYHK